MSKKPDRKLHVRGLVFVIEEAIKRLPNGDERLALSEFPLNYACLGNFPVPDFSERITSDYGMPAENKEIAKDYYEEISTIEKIMEESNLPISLADWQSESKTEATEKIYKGLNRHAYAMQMWDWYAIPWRFRNGLIHLIWSPHDVMGTPIIYSYPIDSFLVVIAENFRKNNIEIEKLTKCRNFWMNLGIILLIIGAIVVWGTIQHIISKYF